MTTKDKIKFQKKKKFLDIVWMVEKPDVNTESPHYISSVLLFGTCWQLNGL